MDIKIKGYTATYLKRQAKNLRKSQGISYVSALDQVAINAGFHNWNHFFNLLSSETTKRNGNHSGAKEPPKFTVVPPEDAPAINPHRKLLVAALNELLRRELISLIAPDDSVDESGHVFADIFGYPAVIMWSNISFEELRISVWWKYDHSLHPQAELTGNARESFSCSSPLANRVHYKKFVGVTVSGWLERKEGKYLQGKGSRGMVEMYTRKGEKEILENIPVPVPNGFKMEGNFHI